MVGLRCWFQDGGKGTARSWCLPKGQSAINKISSSRISHVMITDVACKKMWGKKYTSYKLREIIRLEFSDVSQDEIITRKNSLKINWWNVLPEFPMVNFVVLWGLWNILVFFALHGQNQRSVFPPVSPPPQKMGFCDVSSQAVLKNATFPGPKDRKQYRICPEQDCENLVFTFDPTKSMIEILEPEKEPEWIDRVEVFKRWYKYTGKSWTWEFSEQDKSSWHRGNSQRSQSVPSKLEERVGQALPWRHIGDANVDPDFLYPESGNNLCPVSQGRKMSKQDANQYIQWIISVVPDLDKKSKDPRVYCAYCNKNNHSRFSCNH